MDEPIRTLQNIKDKKHVGQPTRERATPLRIHVLPLLNDRSWKQLLFKKRMYVN